MATKENLLKGIITSTIILLMLSLTGCFSGALTGANLYYDRHSLGLTMDDYTITHNLYNQIDDNIGMENTIVVSTFNRIVLLTGSTPQKAIKDKVNQLAIHTFGVKKVYNFIRIAPQMPMSESIEDNWTENKVRARLITTDSINPGNFKVVADNDTVYLMGVVFPKDAKKAVHIARYTSGVNHVVTVFQYLKISDTA